MADSAVKLYGFVSDTAFFNREFTDSSRIVKVDQGVCCITDKVAQMFGDPSVIIDTRESRVSTAHLMTINPTYAETDLRKFLYNDNTRLDGNLNIMTDFSKLDDKVKSDVITSFTSGNDEIKAFMDFVEILSNKQVFKSDKERDLMALSVVYEDAIDYLEKTYPGKVDAWNFKIVDGDDVFFRDATNVYHRETKGAVATTMHLTRWVRRYFVISFVIKDSKDQDLPIEFHLWCGRDSFIENYPISTITNVILPCKSGYLYDLLDHFKTVSQFTEINSEYFRKQMDEIVKSDDHTGVKNFQTNYYAYPDTQPANTFKMTFGLVYKGHEPSLDEIKAALYKEIMAIDSTITEEMWRKKLPGIFADRKFFMIPVYDNVWKDDESVEHRWGIFDITRYSDLLRKCLSADYVEQLKYAQVIAPRHTNYPVLVVPHLENPATARLISELYPHYIGTTVIDPEEMVEDDMTRNFTSEFNDALANAAANIEASPVDDFPQPNKCFCHFTPKDGIAYHILSKESFLHYTE